MVTVRCHVVASPSIVKFSWTYNNSRDVLPVQGARVNNNALTSQLHFTPTTGELGTLACWASNEVGRQQTPCLFHLVQASEYIVLLPCNYAIKLCTQKLYYVYHFKLSIISTQNRFNQQVTHVSLTTDKSLPYIYGNTIEH